MSTSSAGWVAGADGSREGWVVALWQPSTKTWRVRTVPDVAALLALPEQPVCIGLDMVIGLPDRAAPGGRACDRAARQLLGHPRSSSVFSPPAYPALQARSHAEAQRLNRATAPDAPGLTIQAFHLLPKMRDVAAHITPERQQWVREVHPELAFYALNGGAPMDDSKHTDAGVTQRIDVLTKNGCETLPSVLGTHARGSVTTDDLLDAHAACWSAWRIHTGDAACVPEQPLPTNERGLHMGIWF